MSIHSSLRGVDTLTGERSVLTRMERIQKLRKDGKLDAASEKVLGLPKVRTKFKVAGQKKLKKEEAAPAEGQAAAATAGAKPAGKEEAGKKEPAKKEAGKKEGGKK